MLSFYWLGLKKIFNFGKKIILVFFVYLAIISLFLYFINKDKPKITYDPIKKNREEIYKVINDPQLNKTTEGKIIIASYRTMLCGMIGEACTNNPDDGDKNFNHSLFGFMANLLVLPYANPPASGIYWAYSGLQNAGFVPTTYAAEGIGFAAIKPLMKIWKIFRDLSYMLLVLVLISIGFMIMFRAKINPQTVISIENSIPKIVIALILITFSFPIAGFLIDLMYFAIALIVSILAFQNPNLDVGKLQNEFINASPSILADKLFFVENKIITGPFSQFITAIPQFITAIPFNITTIIESLIKMVVVGSGILSILPNFFKYTLDLLSLIVGIWLGFKIGNAGAFFTDLLKGLGAGTIVIGDLIPGIVKVLLFFLVIPIILIIFLPLIIGLIVFITLLFLFFRIFFMLLTTYLKILFYILLSPLLLTLESIPGQNVFSNWFKTLLAELSTFPLIVGVLLVGNLIISSTVTPIYNLPTKNWAPPFLYNIDQNAWSFLIGYGIVLLIPEIIQLWKQTLGVKESPIKIGLGTFFGGLGIAWGGIQGGTGMLSSLAQMPIIGNRLVQAEGGLGKKLKDWGIIQKPLNQLVAEELAKSAKK